jgi:2'-5' RNA ligase
MTAESYHLTLAFLGDLAEEQVGEMTAHVESQLRRAAPAAPRLQLGGIGVFPGPHRPQVVYVDGHTPAAGAPLDALQAQLAGWLSELGHPREERPFHPHLTIGRVRAAAPAHAPEREAALRALLAEHARAPRGAPFFIDELILYQSELGAAGARYTPLVRLPLPAP